ncbi:hypothetical protein FH972_001440 [Carpinus fangiana]|uniref:Uncharacterized protein n=1 Tax=Carpinus fangiana TaxID=176857 RepID=A0A5N6QC46_9ROSI|nr:hypothetical protein FH972_001440 [Carpinus fangiana]
MAERLISIWVFLLLLNLVKPDVATPLLDEFSGGFSAAGNNLTLEGVAEVENNASSEELMLLVDCVWEKWAVGAVLDVVDPRMDGKFDEAEAVLVLKLGLICSNDEAEARPTMRLVVRYLEGELTLQEAVAMPNKRKGGGRGTVEFEDSTQSTRTIPTTSSVYDIYGSCCSLLLTLPRRTSRLTPLLNFLSPTMKSPYKFPIR